VTSLLWPPTKAVPTVLKMGIVSFMRVAKDVVDVCLRKLLGRLCGEDIGGVLRYGDEEQNGERAGESSSEKSSSGSGM
jgi:hypothetical protein